MENTFTKIGYHENNLISIERKNQIFVAMKPVIKGVGLKWKIYKKNFKEAEFNCIKHEINNQNLILIALSDFHSWLQGIKVKKQFRDQLKFYQTYSYQIIHQYWLQNNDNPCKSCIFGKIRTGIVEERNFIKVNKNNLNTLLRSVDILCHWFAHFAQDEDKMKVAGFFNTSKLGMTLLSGEINRPLIPHDLFNKCSWSEALHQLQNLYSNGKQSKP